MLLTGVFSLSGWLPPLPGGCFRNLPPVYLSALSEGLPALSNLCYWDESSLELYCLSSDFLTGAELTILFMLGIGSLATEARVTLLPRPLGTSGSYASFR